MLCVEVGENALLRSYARWNLAMFERSSYGVTETERRKKPWGSMGGKTTLYIEQSAKTLLAMNNAQIFAQI